MLAALERLLVLQDRDRKLVFLRSELVSLEPQRAGIHTRTNRSQAASESSKQRARQLESERKRLELEADSRKQLIDKYSLQQFQTRKNDEYRALAHEIQLAREAIVKLEDQQLDLMEQAEIAQKETAAALRAAEDDRRASEKQLGDLASREQSLRKELARLEAERGELTAGVDAEILSRYERLRRNKGEKVIVGVEHGVCGGCHMRLPAQILITCQADQEIPSCPNCGRILYYTRDMSLAVAE